MALGVITAIGLLIWQTRRNPVADWFDAYLVVMLAALIAGRAGFILSRWDYFRDQPFPSVADLAGWIQLPCSAA